MMYTYRLDGLCCASCAVSIEKALKKLDGVESAKVSFMTAKLSLEADESKIDLIEPEVGRLVRKIEPHVKLRRV